MHDLDHTSLLNYTHNGLSIRPFQLNDADAFVSAARESVTTVGPWLSWCHSAYTRNEAEAWFDTCSRNRQIGPAYEFGIFTEDQITLLGGVAINQINREHNFANLGYWVRQSRQRLGIATHAVSMTAEFGFTELGLTRLEIVVAGGNHASRGLAEKLNARFEAIAQNRLILRGQPIAAAVYSLLPNQLRKPT